MTTILGIDTASAQCAVALGRDSTILTSASQPGRQGQAERLLPMIESCLRDTGLGYSDLDGIAVTTGPGSFTGLRVGLAAAQALALACDIPALGIDSFTASRLSHPTPGTNCLIILESFRAELYWQLCDSRGVPLTAPACGTSDTITTVLPAGPLSIIGDGAAHFAPWLAKQQAWQIKASKSPDPGALAREGARLLALGLCPSATAFYVRPPDALPAKR